MSRQNAGLGISPSNEKPSSNDVEAAQQGVRAESYNVQLAEATEALERDMTFGQALKADRRLIWYSIGFSGTIIMEGYGLALITYLFTLNEFNKKFGELKPDAAGGPPKYDVEYIYKALLPLTAQFGSLIGLAITPALTKWLGYKYTTLVMLAASGLLVCTPFFAPNMKVLLAGFMLQGIPWGVFQVVSPAYASEISTVQLRPILTTWNNLCWVIGQFVAAAILKGFEDVKSDMGFRIPFSFQWIFSTALFFVILFAPESPYSHLQKKNTPLARKAIVKLVRKGNVELAEAKLALMQHTLHQEEKQGNAGSGEQNRWQRFTQTLRGSDRKRTEIACITWLIQAMCGSSLISWAPKLFESAGLSASAALSVNIALPAAGLVGTLLSWWLMHYMGRRSIYLYGLLAMAVLLTGCGCASFAPGSTSGWAAGGILTVYTLVYDLTVGPICYSIVAEIPSIRHRAATLSAARGTYLAANLVNHFLTPKMVDKGEGAWGLGAKTGFVYAALCLLGAVYTWGRIPETNGLSTRSLDILFQHGASAREFSNAKAAEFEREERERAAELRRQTSKTSFLSVNAVSTKVQQ
ncbi:hypothetical protein QBC35DRAFT_265564 [Podospora australis]|uniref:Major facilitator superfamily (MFS) profile domain-containing protein n=1 Tax=Podospora australis TaxID=1536484 RepID=A0AAN7AHX7_9PEZI|nr:hypothetical protein QBC35DRAFT_265564 [Podospora australis]